MNTNGINIYVSGKSLANLISSFIPQNVMSCRVFTFGHDTHITAQGLNVFILKRLPEKFLDGAKYILCSKNALDLSQQDLSPLYDLWPEPLTPSLVKFYFMKLLDRIEREQHSTSEAIEHQKRIVEMARQDYLTGLATRWYLEEYIRSNQDEKNVTCIYFDLDHFKQVNDTYGHQAGDRALAATAEMMQRDFADGFCARMGGDEFMIVLLGQREASDVEARVNSFMAALMEYYSGTKTMKALSVSAGIAQKTHGDDKSIDTLIHESDMALYEAKNSGRACCRIYSPSMETARGDETPGNYYLVDYENVGSDGLKGVYKLEADSTVCVFYSKNADRVSPELNLQLKETKARVIYHCVEVGIKNALDFQLSTFLGGVITENHGRRINYFIVSRDNGFGSLVHYWREKNIPVDITPEISAPGIYYGAGELVMKITDLTGDILNAPAIAEAVRNSTTKTEVNNALQKLFRGNRKSGEIYRAIRPLIADMPGGNEPRKTPTPPQITADNPQTQDTSPNA